MPVVQERFGQHKGQDVFEFTLAAPSGAYAKIINFGGIITRLVLPDREGSLADITLGCGSMDAYAKGTPYFGAIIGRHANRIEEAQFELDGTMYFLANNHGRHHIHGGREGFDKKIWDAAVDKDQLILSYVSPDGEEHYPGRLHVTVTYSFSADHVLRIAYHAQTDKDTVVNLTNHAYFNLDGHDHGTITDHEVQIFAERFTPINEDKLPTGEVRSAKGTPLDFTEPTAIGSSLHSDHEQIRFGGGFDHNFILDNTGKGLGLAAAVFSPVSGRTMEVHTTKPGLQFYSGNNLSDKITGKGGAVYPAYSAFCMETQYFPNALKHSHFPSPILRADSQYAHVTEYRFGVAAP